MSHHVKMPHPSRSSLILFWNTLLVAAQVALIAVSLILTLTTPVYADTNILLSISKAGELMWNSALTNATYRVEWASPSEGITNWTPLLSLYVTNTTTSVSVPTFYRVVADTTTNLIVGKWSWFNKDVHMFLPTGLSLTSNSVSRGQFVIGGKWRELWPGLYLLTWGTNFADSVYISPSGTQLHGYNQNGTHIFGNKVKQ